MLVTGGAGFIGSNFVRFWLEGHPGDRLVVHDALTYAATPESLVDVAATHGDRYRFVHGDIRDGDAVGEVLAGEKPDVVVNFAAESHNSRCADNLYQSSSHRREWLHVLDHRRGIEAILAGGRLGEIYNIGSGEERDIEWVADSVAAALDLEGEYKSYVPDRPGHDRRYLLDSAKLATELGWSPQIDLDEGVADTVRWYRDHRDWWRPLLARADIDEGGWAASR